MSLLNEIRQQYPSLANRSDDEIKAIIRPTAEFATLTDAQFDLYVGGSTPGQPEESPSTPGFLGGFSAGIDQIQAMGGGLLMAAGDATNSDVLWDKGREIYDRNMAEASENDLGYGFTDIRGAGDAWNWARYTAGNLLPTLAVSVAGGGVGGIAAGIGSRALAGQAAKQAAMKAGQAIGAFGASAGMETGALMGETQDLDVSLAHGSLAGALDALLPFQLLRRAGAGDLADKAASEISDNVLRDLQAQAARSGLQSAGRGSLTGLLTEATTEGLQGLISQHANYWVANNGESLLNNLSEVDVKAIIDEAAAGGLMGTAIGAPSGVMERNQARTQAERIEAARAQAEAEGGDALDQVRAAQNAELETAGQADQQPQQSTAPEVDARLQSAMDALDSIRQSAKAMGYEGGTRLQTISGILNRAERAMEAGDTALAGRLTQRAEQYQARLAQDLGQMQQAQSFTPSLSGEDQVGNAGFILSLEANNADALRGQRPAEVEQAPEQADVAGRIQQIDRDLADLRSQVPDNLRNTRINNINAMRQRAQQAAQEGNAAQAERFIRRAETISDNLRASLNLSPRPAVVPAQAESETEASTAPLSEQVGTDINADGPQVVYQQDGVTVTLEGDQYRAYQDGEGVTLEAFGRAPSEARRRLAQQVQRNAPQGPILQNRDRNTPEIPAMNLGRKDVVTMSDGEGGEQITPQQILERERGQLEGEQRQEAPRGVQSDGADNREPGSEGGRQGDDTGRAEDAEGGRDGAEEGVATDAQQQAEPETAAEAGDLPGGDGDQARTDAGADSEGDGEAARGGEPEKAEIDVDPKAGPVGADPDQELPAFTRKTGATPRGLSEAQVQATVDEFFKRYPGADNVRTRIHRSATTLPGYQEERDGAGSGASIAGQYDSRRDTVHLVSTAFDSEDAVIRTLQEEILVHKGLGFFSQAERQQLYKDIQAASKESQEVKALWDKTVREYQPVAESARLNEEQSNRLYAEELLGTLARERPNWMKKGWRKLWRGIKRLLVKAGWVQSSTGINEFRDKIQFIAKAFQKGQRAPRRDFQANIQNLPERAPIEGESEPRYSVSDRPDTKPLANSIKAAISSIPELAGTTIIDSADQLPEKAIKQMALDNIDLSTVRGLYVDGDLYVVAENVSSLREGIQTAVHEAVGHKGIRGVLGKELDTVMLQLYRSLPNHPKGREALAEVRQLYPFLDPSKREGRISIAEEMVAHLLEKGYRPKAWQRAVSKIRELLRRLIPSVAWTYTDVLSLGEQAREHLRRRKAGDADEAMRYSLRSKSRRLSDGDLFDDFSDADRSAAAKVGPKSMPRRIMDSWRELTDNAGLRIRQGAVDRVAAFKEMDEKLFGDSMLEENITRSSWVLARMSNAASGALNTMLHTGRIMLDPEQKVLVTKDDDSTGLGSVFAQLASHNDPDSGGAELQRFLGWIAGNRARKLSEQGRENLFTEQDIAAMETWDRGTLPDGRNRAEAYQEVFRQFQAYRDDILAVADQAGLLRKGMDDAGAVIALAKKAGVRGDLRKKAKAGDEAAIEELRTAVRAEMGDAAFNAEYEILTTDQRELWANEFYVPFYRINEEEKQPTGQLSTNGLSRQQAYKKLKGGKENLNDLLQNTLMNFHHLLDASLKNQAAQQAVKNAGQLGIARKVPESNRDTKKSTFVMENGEKVFYEIDDPLVFQSLTALSSSGMNGSIMKILRKFKRIFTNMATATPQFMAANLIRDSLQATATNEVSKNAIGNVVGGLKSYRDQKIRAQMMASGAAFNFGHLYGNNPDELRAQLTRDLRGASLIDSPKAIPAMVMKGWDWWNNVNNTAENINRAAIFTQNQDKGTLRAAFEARDLIDFSAHGAWPAVRVLIDIVPFLNARIQGLDKIYRSGVKPGAGVMKAIFSGNDPSVSDKQAAGRFWTVTGALALATVALYLHNQDDEEYQKLEDWQKDTYWFIRFGDQAFFIPKPFEVGAIATMAERITEQFVDDKATGRLFRERMLHMMTDTFAFSPIPQAAQPLLDIYSNYDAFTGRPIESMGMERLSPELRKRYSTSKVGEWASIALNSTIGAIGSPDKNPFALSPIQVDHLIGGYFGQIGTWLAGSGDIAWRVATGEEAPARRWYEYQPIRRFYRNLGDEDKYTRYGTVFYEGLREAARAQADVKELREMGRLAEATELAESKRELLALRTPLNRAQRRLREINQRIDIIRRSDTDGELKRQQIERLQAIKNQIQRALGEKVLEARAS